MHDPASVAVSCDRHLALVICAKKTAFDARKRSRHVLQPLRARSSGLRHRQQPQPALQ